MQLSLAQLIVELAEIKIVYAVNPSVASQLYEVDVFMFFLQDLEAVSNSFYHDLWQAVRLHTPKVQPFNQMQSAFSPPHPSSQAVVLDPHAIAQPHVYVVRIYVVRICLQQHNKHHHQAPS